MTQVIFRVQVTNYFSGKFKNLNNIMKAVAEIGNLKCHNGKHTIVRNLKQILDIRIVDIDLENGLLIFFYDDPLTLQKVRQELRRIGYPMKSCTCTGKRQAKRYQDNDIDFKNISIASPDSDSALNPTA